jgi:hypothetical protein
MATLDAGKLTDILSRLGDNLRRPATLCLIGSAPAILSGQPARQTADIDLWHRGSEYDSGDLEQACRAAGLLFNPLGELDQEASYIQIVRPGVVQLPANFTVETLGRWGKLTVTMPSPALIVAAKLVRGSDLDMQDAVWWTQQRRIPIEDIEKAIADLPVEGDRETASENLAVLRLVARP